MRYLLLFSLSVTLGLASNAARGEGAAVPAELFKQLDKNGDGKLSGDEIPDDKKSLFERLVRIADKDSDGQLVAAEFEAGLGGSPADADQPKVDESKASKSEPKAEKADQANKPERPKKPGKPAKNKKAKKPAAPAAGEKPDRAQVFKRLDANADGKLVLDEIPEKRRDGFEKVIARADKNKDGGLSLDEFTGGTPATPAKAKKRPQAGGDGAQLFQRMDKNGDGKVTADEIPAERRGMVEKMIKRGDKDGDGAISSEEFAAIVKARASRAQAQPPAQRGAAGPAGLFRSLDADGNQELSSEEINAAPEALRKLDKDGDGKLKVREVAAPQGKAKAKKAKQPKK